MVTLVMPTWRAAFDPGTCLAFGDGAFPNRSCGNRLSRRESLQGRVYMFLQQRSEMINLQMIVGSADQMYSTRLAWARVRSWRAYLRDQRKPQHCEHVPIVVSTDRNAGRLRRRTIRISLCARSPGGRIEESVRCRWHGHAGHE